MILLSDVINEFEDRFLTQYKNMTLPGHRKALRAMKRCRKEHGPHMLARCTGNHCDNQMYIPHSCGHRNCPHCQNHENWQWIENQLEKRLPAPYYLITFTLSLTTISGYHPTPRKSGWSTARKSAAAAKRSFTLVNICIKASSRKRTSSAARTAWSPSAKSIPEAKNIAQGQ